MKNEEDEQASYEKSREEYDEMTLTVVDLLMVISTASSRYYTKWRVQRPD